MSDAGYRMLGAGARGMTQKNVVGREVGGGSCLGSHVHPWWIHVNVWQNRYSIVKQNKVKIKKNFKKFCTWFFFSIYTSIFCLLSNHKWHFNSDVHNYIGST